MTQAFTENIALIQAGQDSDSELIGSLSTELGEARIQIAELMNNLAVARQYSTARLVNIDTLYEKIRKAETYMIDAVDTGDAEEEILIGLASIFDWDVTKEIEVTVTAIWKGTLTVPRSFETDYLDEQMNVECNLGSEIDGSLDCDEVSVEVN